MPLTSAALVWALLVFPPLSSASSLPLTLRRQVWSMRGRAQWLEENRAVDWDAASTGIVVVDMWDKHWCESATLRVGELAVPMNATLAAARAAGVQVIFAPSDVYSVYDATPSRQWVLALPNATLPTATKVKVPTLPLSTATDGGCDTACAERTAWTRQIDTLHIAEEDAMISSVPGVGQQELFNVITAKKLSQLIYMGVHENMCILNRPFAIEQVTSWGWGSRDNLAVVRELVDVMYTPQDPPYVSHTTGLKLHTEYMEKFWASSVSMYDILRLGSAGGGGMDESGGAHLV